MASRLFTHALARDIRDDYVDYLSDGLSPSEATRKLTQDFPNLATDSPNTPLFWQALAAIQNQLGHSVKVVMARAAQFELELA